MKTCTKKAGRILSEDGNNLDKIHRKAAQLKLIDKKLSQCLDPKLAPYCHLVNFSNGTLTIGCDSAQWLTLLRFEVPQLLSVFRSGQSSISVANIRCKVVQQVTEPKRRSIPKAKLSKGSAKTIQSLADTTEDEALKKILEKLARRAES